MILLLLLLSILFFLFSFIFGCLHKEICRFFGATSVLRTNVIAYIYVCVFWMSLLWIGHKISAQWQIRADSERVIRPMPKSASISLNTFWLHVFSWQYFICVKQVGNILMASFSLSLAHSHVCNGKFVDISHFWCAKYKKKAHTRVCSTPSSENNSSDVTLDLCQIAYVTSEFGASS